MIETNHKKSINFFYYINYIQFGKTKVHVNIQSNCFVATYTTMMIQQNSTLKKNDGRKDQNKVNDNLVICPRGNNDDFALDKEQEEAQMESEVRGIATHYSRFKRLDSSAL